MIMLFSSKPIAIDKLVYAVVKLETELHEITVSVDLTLTSSCVIKRSSPVRQWLQAAQVAQVVP